MRRFVTGPSGLPRPAGNTVMPQGREPTAIGVDWKFSESKLKTSSWLRSMFVR